MRQIILDTETTGLRVEEGHRLIEIGCIEMINRQLTGEHYHVYLNPGRDIDPGAIAVHGITNKFLEDKPTFSSIVNDFLSFVKDSELVIHNAPFDIGFINNELQLLKSPKKPISDICSVVDTLQLARQRHVGQRNSLDALCKRYKIDNSKRELHGALVDAHLLALVYLAMTGGQGSFFDVTANKPAVRVEEIEQILPQMLGSHQLVIELADEEELSKHREYLAMLHKKGKCLWSDS